MASADGAERALRHKAGKTKRKAEAGTGWYAAVARAGLVAKGVSYALVGVLAVAVAVGHGGKATSRSGALASVADEPWGKVALTLLALGFAAHALWRFVQAVAEREDHGGKAERLAKKWGRRGSCLGSGFIYAGLTFLTIRLLAGSNGQESQNEKARQTTATVLHGLRANLVGFGSLGGGGRGSAARQNQSHQHGNHGVCPLLPAAGVRRG